MTKVPVLVMLDFSKPFVIETYASGFAVGAMLMQEKHPMAFHSQVLGQRACLKLAYEKELMAIVFVVLKWRPYLLGKHFIIRTNKRSLKYLLAQGVIGPDYHKWVCKLLGYDFEIQYKPGQLNRATDALSRKPGRVECASLMAPQWRDWDKLKSEVGTDEFFSRIVQDLSQGTAAHSGFTLQQGLLFFKGLLFIPRSSYFIPTILAKFHSAPIGGHSKEAKTYQRIASELY